MRLKKPLRFICILHFSKIIYYLFTQGCGTLGATSPAEIKSAFAILF